MSRGVPRILSDALRAMSGGLKMSTNMIELIKSLIRPLGLMFWLVIRTLCAAQRVELPLSLTIPFDAATLEYFTERAVKRLKEK